MRDQLRYSDPKSTQFCCPASLIPYHGLSGSQPLTTGDFTTLRLVFAFQPGLERNGIIRMLSSLECAFPKPKRIERGSFDNLVIAVMGILNDGVLMFDIQGGQQTAVFVDMGQ